MSATIYCDHCGKPTAAERIDRTRARLELPFGNFAADLCPQCLDELLAFIGRGDLKYAKEERP